MPCLSQKTYKKEFEQTKAKNEFKPTDTESYKEMKQVANVSSDVSILLHWIVCLRYYLHPQFVVIAFLHFKPSILNVERTPHCGQSWF